LVPATNVRVITLWTDATTSVPVLPNDFWTTTFPANSSTCGGLDTSTGWNLVDSTKPCQDIPVVNPELPEVAGFDWSVPASAAEHSCMLVIVESSEDPIDPGVRAVLDPAVLVPQDRHISQRNLHIIQLPTPSPGPSGGGSSPHAPSHGVEWLNVPNPSKSEPSLQLFISRAGMPKGSRLGLILPPSGAVTCCELEFDRAKLSQQEKEAALKNKVDAKTMYLIYGREASVTELPIPPGQTWKIGIVYDAAAIKPGTSARFTVLTRQAHTVLGGSTYILRRARK
jgi:hypothetical protein